MTAFIVENSSVCTKVQSLKFVVLVAEPAGISLYSVLVTRYFAAAQPPPY